MGSLQKSILPAQPTDFIFHRLTLFALVTAPRCALLHRYGFREVAGLVHVGAFDQGGVIAEQLQRNDVKDGREHAVVLGQTQDMHAFGLGDFAAGIGKDIELAAAGLHFLQIGLQLFEQAVGGGDGDDWHFLVHQGQRTVLEFAGGVGFGVDVIRPIQPQARSAVAYPAPHWLGQA